MGGRTPGHKQQIGPCEESYSAPTQQNSAFVFSQISAPMNFPSQGRRRLSLHWTSPQGPGTVSCTTRTT